MQFVAATEWPQELFTLRFPTALDNDCILGCALLAQSGHTELHCTCPLLDQSGQSWILGQGGLCANDPKR